MMVAGEIDLTWMITHRLKFDDIAEAYDTFDKKADGMIKAVFTF